jgi:thiaminase (transcriptional activator TenA)
MHSRSILKSVVSLAEVATLLCFVNAKESQTSTLAHGPDGFPFELPPFAAILRTHAAADFGRSFRHPFVLSLANGSLAAETFRFYQMQDARYLEALADAASLISTRTHEPDSKMWWIEAARLALIVERSLHLNYGTKLGYGPADIAALRLTPTNRAYQAHLVDTATRGSLVEAIAAFAPCPWLYASLGQHLQRTMGEPAADHPYAEWLKTYAAPDFLTYMSVLLEELQTAANAAGERELTRAKEAFLTSVRYEWAFWEQAWVREGWPGETMGGDAAGDALVDDGSVGASA